MNYFMRRLAALGFVALLIWQWDNVVAFVNLMRGPPCEVWDCGARLFG